MIFGLGGEWLALSFILLVHQARVVMIHVRMRIQSTCNRRIYPSLHLERPLIRIADLVAKFKPGRRAIVASRQANEFHRRAIEVVMDPVRVAIEILDGME